MGEIDGAHHVREDCLIQVYEFFLGERLPPYTIDFSSAVSLCCYALCGFVWELIERRSQGR